MLFSIYSALAVSAGFAHAFTDTSPFFMFSTSELLTNLPQIASGETVSREVISQLSKCPSDTYVIVTQPGVNAEDYSYRYAAPHLRKQVLGEDKRIRSTVTVTDVLGDVDADTIIQDVGSKCGAALLKVDASTGSFTIADDPKPRIINLEYPSLPTTSSKQRASKLKDNDAFLSSVLDLLPTSKYTVIYLTTPSTSRSSSPVNPNSVSHDHHLEQETYEMDTSFSSQQHMELKRDFAAHLNEKREENITLPDAPLFERYQYFTPGTSSLTSLPAMVVSKARCLWAQQGKEDG
ncbi:MAG: hypothetical protein Q9181_003210 [Wetmoreana brouardii]